MPSSAFALAIAQHTPLGVWALLAALVALGVVQSKARSVTVSRATVLPLVLLALSLWGVVSVFAQAEALGAWAAGVVAAAALNLRWGSPQGARWSATEQRFHLPGSWVPMVLMLGIFCTKFAIGVSLARNAGFSGALGFAVAASLAYGLFSGVFLGRALVLWRKTQGRAVARAA